MSKDTDDQAWETDLYKGNTKFQVNIKLQLSLPAKIKDGTQASGLENQKPILIPATLFS